HRRQPSRAVYEVPRRSLAVLARGRRSRVVLAPLKALSLRGGATLQLQATVASQVHSPGRARNKPVKTTAQGKPGVPSAPVSACARTFFLRARLRVQWAPGFLSALSFFDGARSLASLGQKPAARWRMCVSSLAV